VNHKAEGPADVVERYDQLRAVHKLSDARAFEWVLGELEWWQYAKADRNSIAAFCRYDVGAGPKASLLVALSVKGTEFVRADRDGGTIEAMFNPWHKAETVPHFTFEHASKAAHLMGLPKESPDRDNAMFMKALKNVLKLMWHSGDTHASYEEVIREMEKLS
jgi:hypothetical protein